MSPRLFAPLVLFAAALTAFLCPAAASAVDEFRHEVRVMGKLGNHPNVVTFIGAVTTGVAIVDTRDGENPLYTGQNGEAENPLFEGAADPGSPTGVQSIMFMLDNTGFAPQSTGNGVVHRDIAARNVLVTTNGGTYSSGPDAFLLLGHDGGVKVRGSGVGPIRWMAPEALRLFSTDPTASPDDYFDVLAGSYIEVHYVPEPVTAALLVLGAVGLRRRHA